MLDPDIGEDTLTVFVKDDGDGFDIQAVTAKYDERGSLGIINSRERADAINGSFTIRSDKGKGTEVILRLPLKENLLKESKDNK
jgi:signal transduction histidine kinase